MKQVRKFFQLTILLLFSLKSFASEPITREGEISFILSAKYFIAKQKYNEAIACLEETFFHSKERDKMLENLEKIFREKKDFPALIKTLNKQIGCKDLDFKKLAESCLKEGNYKESKLFIEAMTPYSGDKYLLAKTIYERTGQLMPEIFGGPQRFKIFLLGLGTIKVMSMREYISSIKKIDRDSFLSLKP